MPSQNQYRIRQFHYARFCPALRVFSLRYGLSIYGCTTSSKLLYGAEKTA